MCSKPANSSGSLQALRSLYETSEYARAANDDGTLFRTYIGFIREIMPPEMEVVPRIGCENCDEDQKMKLAERSVDGLLKMVSRQDIEIDMTEEEIQALNKQSQQSQGELITCHLTGHYQATREAFTASQIVLRSSKSR